MREFMIVFLSLIIIIGLLRVIYDIYQIVYKMWQVIVKRMTFSRFMSGFGASILAVITCIILSVMGGFVLRILLMVLFN